jgi:hypothetical protein
MPRHRMEEWDLNYVTVIMSGTTKSAGSTPISSLACALDAGW